MDKNEAIEILKELPERIAAVIMPSDRFFDYKEALRFAISHLEADKEADIYEEHSCLTCKYGNLYSDSEPCCNCTEDNDMYEPDENEVTK